MKKVKKFLSTIKKKLNKNIKLPKKLTSCLRKTNTPTFCVVLPCVSQIYTYIKKPQNGFKAFCTHSNSHSHQIKSAALKRGFKLNKKYYKNIFIPIRLIKYLREILLN